MAAGPPELCEKGLKTLVLERGRMVRHVADYPTANQDPWDMPGRGALTPAQQAQQEKQRRTGFVDAGNAHFFVNDVEHPYSETQRFDWIRGYQVGGRSLTWGRQCYRWSDLDFEANATDGVGIDWPFATGTSNPGTLRRAVRRCERREARSSPPP